jgi:hypothetical protein
MLNQSHVEPYLSVVVTTRNDDHGGDPLARLQAFVNCFDEQCRRSRLDAEVIVVEWNPPPDKPRVGALLRLPERPFCTYRFIEVSSELHRQLQHADVLPLFQMIAKNVGIRRARGRFVLATNIDIILSTELVEYLARQPLQPRRLYRVDRHDIQADVPLDAPLESQMAYCASHQLRVHGRSGSRPVDPRGRQAGQSEDVVDGRGVRLGAGWHVRETGGPGRPFRWASDVATLVVVPADAGLDGELVLDVDLESNPYDSASWVDLAVRDGETTVVTRRVSGRMRLGVPVGPVPHAASREIHLSVVQTHPEHRRQLPVFERRDGIFYRLYSATLAQAASGAARFQYPIEPLTNANPHSGLTMASAPERVALPERAVRSWWSARDWKSSIADRLARLIVRIGGNGLRYRIARSSPEFQKVEQALRDADEEVRALAPLQPLADFHRFLRDRRPDNLHVNSSGDFQLMAREHWDELRGYPEFETFSMNIDGLFSYIADAAGIREEALPMPIYHLEHEVGSGWSPEGEALLRRRIAERGITWLDAHTVYIWAAYMHWLGRPIFFNGPNWGMASAELPERTALHSSFAH